MKLLQRQLDVTDTFSSSAVHTLSTMCIATRPHWHFFHSILPHLQISHTTETLILCISTFPAQAPRRPHEEQYRRVVEGFPPMVYGPVELSAGPGSTVWPSRSVASLMKEPTAITWRRGAREAGWLGQRLVCQSSATSMSVDSLWRLWQVVVSGAG